MPAHADKTLAGPRRSNFVSQNRPVPSIRGARATVGHTIRGPQQRAIIRQEWPGTGQDIVRFWLVGCVQGSGGFFGDA